MDKTVKYQIPYPTTDDLIRDTPKILRSLAEQLEELIATNPGPKGERGPAGKDGAANIQLVKTKPTTFDKGVLYVIPE